MRELLRRMDAWSGSRWKWTALAAAGAAAALAAAAVHGAVGSGAWPWAAPAAAAVAATAAAGGALLLYLQLQQLREAEQLRALVNVRPLAGRLPLDLAGWAADPVFADELVRHVGRRRPGLVVECGSGWTTVLAAACLEELGRGRIVALEHLAPFAERTRRLLADAGLAHRAEVVTAPLEDWRLADGSWRWYARDGVAAVEGPVDLLVVDGPPGRRVAGSRYPAVPVLADRLAPDACVLLDDGLRPGEERIARAWGGRLGVEPVLDARGQGLWVLDLGADGTDRSGDGEVEAADEAAP